MAFPHDEDRSGWEYRLACHARHGFLLTLFTLLLLLPLLLIPIPTQSPPVHSKELGVRVLLPVLAVLFVAAWPALPRRRMDLAEVALLCVPVTGLVSTVFSSRPGFSFQEGWQNWALPLLGWMVLRIGLTVGEMRRLLLVVVGAAVMAAVYGVSAFFGMDFLRGVYPFLIKADEGRNFVHSFLGNPEYFGGYVAAVSVVALAQILRGDLRATARIAWLGAGCLLLFSLLLSGTRGAIIGFFAGMGLVLWRVWPLLGGRLRRVALLALGGLLVAGAAMVVVFSFPNPLNPRDMRLAQRFAGLFDLRSPSMRERVLFYAVSAKMIERNPVFGDGPATYQLNFYPAVLRLQESDPRAGVLMMTEDLKGGVADHAHNDYLEIWADRGTLGLAAVLLFLSVAAVRFGRLRVADLSDDGALARQRVFLAAACFGGAACVFINAAFSFPLHMPVRGSLAWVLAACFLGAAAIPPVTSAAPARGGEGGGSA